MFPKGMEWIVILIIALLIFGPKNLPKLGKSLGSTVKNIREGMSGDDDAASKDAEETVIEAGEDADDDAEIHEYLKVLHDEDTSIRVGAERAMNARLNGGCQVPIAGFAEINSCLSQGQIGQKVGACFAARRAPQKAEARRR